MNQILSLLPPDGWPRFSADAVWQSTLAGFLCLVCIRLVARRPATRALVSVVAMLTAVALPVVSAAARSMSWGLLQPPMVAEARGDDANRRPVVKATDSTTKSTGIEASVDATANVFASRPVRSSELRGSAVGGRQSTRESLIVAAERLNVTTPFVILWCTASGVMVIRLLVSAIQMRRLLNEATPCSDAGILAALREAARRIGLAPPAVVVSKAVKSPTVFAFGRGVVLLPACEGDSVAAPVERPPLNRPGAGGPARWLAVFCHELGHVRRRDGWNRLTVEIGLALLPWQPLVWLLRREFLRHCEEACDDWAVANGADPIELASLLTEFVPSLPRLLLGVSIMTTDAKTRILRLLALRGAPRPRANRTQIFGLILCASIVVVGVAMAQQTTDERPTQVSDKGTTVNPAAKLADQADPKGKNNYVLESPDLVHVELVRLLPKGTLRIETLDRLELNLTDKQSGAGIRGVFTVEDGEIDLGRGRLKVAGLSLHEAVDAIATHLAKYYREPKISLRFAQRGIERQGDGLHLIKPDGSISLGSLGSIHIAGMTIDEAQKAIEKHLSKDFDRPSVVVTLWSQNSRVYYVIVENGDKGDPLFRLPMGGTTHQPSVVWRAGDTLFRLPVTGNETVLDALTQCDNLRRVSDLKIWIHRKKSSRKDDFVQLPVDLKAISQGDTTTNYKIVPGDRIFVQGASLSPPTSNSLPGDRP